MTIKINVPQWTEGIEDEGLLALTWFLRNIERRYGNGDWFQFHITDINMLLGEITHLETILAKWNVSREHIQVGKALDKKILIKIGATKPIREVEITQERLVLVIVYLKGCMTKNLMEPDNYKTDTSYDRELRQLLSFR